MCPPRSLRIPATVTHPESSFPILPTNLATYFTHPTHPERDHPCQQSTQTRSAPSNAPADPVVFCPLPAFEHGVIPFCQTHHGSVSLASWDPTQIFDPMDSIRPDLKIFLPPINGVTIYIIGSVESIPDLSKPLVVRLHDESADSVSYLLSAAPR